MDKRGLRYRCLDNAFVRLEDPARAQRLADRFAILKWPALLDTLARRVNPLLGDLLASYRDSWATNQAEDATDVFFKNRPALRDLDPRRRWPGARVKHWMKENWIKMYAKHECALRVETVINNPDGFKGRGRGGRRGRRALGWYPLPKGVAFLTRYVVVSATANQRYLDALAVVDDPAPAYQALDRLAHLVRDALGRSQRAFNPAAAADLRLFETVLRGEHTRHGFRHTATSPARLRPGCLVRSAAECARLTPAHAPARARAHCQDSTVPALAGHAARSCRDECCRPTAL